MIIYVNPHIEKNTKQNTKHRHKYLYNRLLYMTAAFDCHLTVVTNSVNYATPTQLIIKRITDILGARRGTWVLILFGQCSMAAWVITQFFSSSLTDAANCFVRGIPRLIGTDAYQPIFVAVARAALLVWLLWQWRRLRSCRSAKETLPSRL